MDALMMGGEPMMGGGPMMGGVGMGPETMGRRGGMMMMDPAGMMMGRSSGPQMGPQMMDDFHNPECEESSGKLCS